MGLNMYLHKKIIVGAQFDITEVMYWRKTNAIHRWFVENVQGGDDDCKPHIVEVEQLEELLDVVTKVISSPELAPRLLPTMNGFFFGSQEYDDRYWEDLTETIKILEKILTDPAIREFNYEFIYKSDW